MLYSSLSACQDTVYYCAILINASLNRNNRTFSLSLWASPRETFHHSMDGTSSSSPHPTPPPTPRHLAQILHYRLNTMVLPHCAVFANIIEAGDRHVYHVKRLTDGTRFHSVSQHGGGHWKSYRVPAGFIGYTMLKNFSGKLKNFNSDLNIYWRRVCVMYVHCHAV